MHVDNPCGAIAAVRRPRAAAHLVTRRRNWGYDSRGAVSIWVALDDATESNGCETLLPLITSFSQVTLFPLHFCISLKPCCWL